MDFVTATTIFNAVRDSAEMLLSGATEPLSLAVWGFGLLAVGAAFRSLIAPARAHRFDVQDAGTRALTESRA